MEVFCGPQEARHGVGWAAGERNLIFYADDGRIGGRDHIWVKDALTVSVVMFRRMGLDMNLDKTKLKHQHTKRYDQNMQMRWRRKDV